MQARPHRSLSHRMKYPCADLMTVEGDTTVYVVPSGMRRAKRARYTGWLVQTVDGERFLSDHKCGSIGQAYLAAVAAVGVFHGMPAQQQLRSVTTMSGETFIVPSGLRRVEYVHKHTFGWIVRRVGGKTKLFSDGRYGSAQASYLAALDLCRTIIDEQAQSTEPSLRRVTQAKTSGLPEGIYGPILKSIPGRSAEVAYLVVSIPIFGKRNKVKWLYLGTEATYTVEKFNRVLKRAKTLRAESLRDYRIAMTAASRTALEAVASAAGSM